jgi:hypothetical protein
LFSEKRGGLQDNGELTSEEGRDWTKRMRVAVGNTVVERVPDAEYDLYGGRLRIEGVEVYGWCGPPDSTGHTMVIIRWRAAPEPDVSVVFAEALSLRKVPGPRN